MTADTHAQYLDCRRRLFDSPFDAALRDEMLVLGDALESEGDSLGRRVALSEALFVERDRGARSALRTELNTFSNVERRKLFGPIAPLLEYRHALSIDWRGGAPFTAHIDARYITKLAQMEPDELVGLVVQAPVLAPVRRLRIRVRNYTRAQKILAVIDSHRPRFELEELLIGTNPRPRRIGSRSTPVAYESRGNSLVSFAEKCPSLWLVSDRVGQAMALQPHMEATRWDAETRVHELEELEGPFGAQKRGYIGRCLWSPEAPLRLAAMRMIVRHQLLDAFTSSIHLILRPKVCKNQGELVSALAKAGPRAQRFAPLLARIASSAPRYDDQTRRAAGRGLAAVRVAEAPTL